MNKTLIKICGLTRPEEIGWVTEVGADYLGMVLFCEKSKRNLTLTQAREMLEERKHLRNQSSLLHDDGRTGEMHNRPDIAAFPQTVDVMISPTPEQIMCVLDAGFDRLQIHGSLSGEALACVQLPLIKAFNVTDVSTFPQWQKCPKVAAYLFDAGAPGSGQTFDWNMLTKIPRDERPLFLAGGLTPELVAEAIRAVSPDGVDVSSGVEGADGRKSKEKIEAFVRNVRAADEK